MFLLQDLFGSITGASKNTSTTISDHLDDLSDIYDEESSVRNPVLALLTDGGPNCHPSPI